MRVIHTLADIADTAGSMGRAASVALTLLLGLLAAGALDGVEVLTELLVVVDEGMGEGREPLAGGC